MFRIRILTSDFHTFHPYVKSFYKFADRGIELLDSSAKSYDLTLVGHSLFQDKKIGVVQTRWGHINRNYSLLTKVQAFALDMHFTLEQVGRNYGGHFMNFNGTAGVWRKACIEDAGNWEGDTFIFVIIAPELPARAPRMRCTVK